MPAFPAPRSILITGASSGIGAALALHYAAPGVTLFLGGRDAERLNAVADGCAAQGARTVCALADVTDAAAMADWIGAADDDTALDLAVANAGISGGTGGHGEDPAQVARIFDVNVNGVLNTIAPVRGRMAARRRGQIAVMSSLAGFCGWPGAPAYSASKAAVRVYGEALYGALRPYGVGVSVLCPGFIATPMTAVNDYRMPFLMDAPRAAAIIARGLARGRVRIAFPLRTYGFAGFFGLLPPGLCSALLRRFPAKTAQPGTM
jgi:short-subunit dehydrogenase